MWTHKASFGVVFIILLAAGCPSLVEKAPLEPCSLSPFTENSSEFPGQTQLQVGYYSYLEETFFTANVDGENKTAWANGVYPMWSPDRKKIAYREKDSLCFANSDGSQIQKVAQGENLRDLAWSPDGNFMAFTAWSESEQDEIYMVSLTGEITQLTFSPKADDGDPAWSPDSKEIAFVTYSDPVDTGGYIQYTITISVLNIISRQTRPITLNGLKPAWSPAGTKLLYESADNRICTVDANGENKSCLTSGFKDYGAQWSPDGKQIAFTRIDKTRSIYTMNSDGSNQTWLANGIFPVWSPDGSKIAYGTGGESWYVYTIYVNGSEPSLITKDASGYIWLQP